MDSEKQEEIGPPPRNPDKITARKRFQQCAAANILKRAVPEEFGGLGDSFQDLCRAHGSLGLSSRDPGLILSINAHIWGAVFPLLRYGTPEQKIKWLPGLLSGEFIAGHAISEPAAGSDLQAMQCQANLAEDGYRLKGHKRWITNTPIADLLIVYGLLNDQPSAFIVLADDAGAKFSDSPATAGCVSAPMGDLILTDCHIPGEHLLGRPGAGIQMIQQALELERAFIFAGIAGVMQWQLDSVIQFSRERRVNRAPLGHNQAISHRIAEMKLRLDTARLWVTECARLRDANKRITLASAQAKLYASEAFLQSSLDAAHILGASGLTDDNPMGYLVQDAMAGRLFSGSSEIQKNIIAALLGTGEGYKGN